ncbi:MAG: serine/threonine-protein phosphatase [Treponemataceae bacterium]|nr:serine/threonine-protein phosphatase [Treponemataceae bacterium]
MIYIILNFVLSAVLVWFSSFEDVRNDSERVKPVINIVLFLAVIAFFSAGAILVSLFGNKQLVTILGKGIFLLISWFSISISFYLFSFPKVRNGVATKILKLIIFGLSCFVIFSKIQDIDVSLKEGIKFESDLFPIFNASWVEIFFLFFAFVLPGLAELSIIFRFQAEKNKLYRQQLLLLIVAVPASIVATLLLCQTATKWVPAFSLLYTFGLAVLVFLIYKIVTATVLVDVRIVASSLVDFVFNYILVSIIAGILFAVLQPLRMSNVLLFVLIYGVLTGVLLVAGYQGTKYLRKLRNTRDANYSHHFEEDLSKLDYTESPETLNEKLSNIFAENVHMTFLDLLIESNENNLETMYSSRGKKVSIPLSNPLFDTALNAKINVIFKSHIDTKHVLSSANKELSDFFYETQGEVLIILNEGRHIFAAIVLGEKRLGNAYTDYDYSVFTNLYSYFFVIGYYLKNIANEAVVGTVNREIQMSGQIIQSIQENMDFIKNPKADVGYVSVAAHNLGGEYVDFIRLTDERHMIILGDISGKGINASMSSVILKSVVRTFLAETHDFKQLIQKVNVFIRNNLPKGTFLAGVFMLMDFSDNTLYYINCGTPAMFMYTRAYNNVIEVQGEGRVLGFVKNVDKLVKVRKVKLNSGDMILTCTDGLLEGKSIRGEKFGKDRVQRSIMDNLSFPSDKMSQFLCQELSDFTSKELEDDVSVVVIKYLEK